MTSPKRPHDPNQLAKFIVDAATGEVEDAQPVSTPAAEHGRRGGQLGSKARANALAPNERQEIARKAGKARWAKEGTE